mgnify:CR=1 FL=1
MIIVHQDFNKDRRTVWKAITELDQMKQWYFENIPEFKAEVGFTTQFLVTNNGKDFTHQWTVTEVIPYKKITYDWTYKEYPGKGEVTFDLSGINQKTILMVMNKGLNSFPEDIPEFSRKSCQDGWGYFIQERLKAYLDK